MLLLVLAVFCACVSAVPGCTSSSPPHGITALLPSGSVLKGWTPEDAPEVYDGQALYDFIDGGAEIFFEYGFKAAASQGYDKGESSLQVELYEMTDDAAAFGIFSMNRSSRGTSIALGAAGQEQGNTVTFWQRNYYVRVIATKAGGREPMLGAARDIETKIGGERGAVPQIMALLPARNKVEGSEMFLRGKIALNQIYYVGDDEPFGLAAGRGAAVATYQISGTTCTVLVARYDTQDERDAAFGKAANLFGGKGELQNRTETQFDAKDKTGKSIAVVKKGLMVTVAFGARTGDLADLFASASG